MFCGNVLLYSAGLAHQKGLAEVAPGLLRDLLGELRWEEQTLLFTDCCQNITDLVNRKSRDEGKNKNIVIIETKPCEAYFRHSNTTSK